MKQAIRSLARKRSLTRVVGAVVLMGVLFVIAACGKGKILMTDAELDRVHAGTVSWGLLGINGPWVGSLLQVFDSSLTPTPSCATLPGASTNCVTLFSSSPLPPSGSVLLEQSLVVQGPFSYQSVVQRNSAATAGPQQPLQLNCVTCQLLLDLNRVPGRW